MRSALITGREYIHVTLANKTKRVIYPNYTISLSMGLEELTEVTDEVLAWTNTSTAEPKSLASNCAETAIIPSKLAPKYCTSIIHGLKDGPP
jgi:hypothetical protein